MHAFASIFQRLLKGRNRNHDKMGLSLSVNTMECFVTKEDLIKRPNAQTVT